VTFAAGLGLAAAAIAKNLLRSALAMVGVVIGVAAVVTMVALGRGAQDEVEGEVGSAGTNLVYVRAGNYVRGGDALDIPSGFGSASSLTTDDARAIGGIPGVERVTEVVDDRAPLVANGKRSFGPVVGCGPAFTAIHGFEPLAGRFITEAEVRDASLVAVLGSSVADTLFGAGRDPVGGEIEIRDLAFTVVGVLDEEETVYVPFTSLQKNLGIDHLHGVTVAAESAGEASRIADEIRRLLRSRHGLDDPGRAKTLPRATGPFAMRGTGSVPDDFTVRTEASRALTQGLYTPTAALALASMPRLDEVTSEEMAGTLARASQTMTLLLASIASVSLVVGGIGIMNVMLLSVTERTMEVGLRMSVGARARDVLLQFLLEAVGLSLAGGILGIAFGLGCASALTRFLEWPTHLSQGAVALAFGLAFAVGVSFGYYPAYRASRLDPIDALRYE
jgi:ABC-type antimicrobial peptide transport system permease subunit